MDAVTTNDNGSQERRSSTMTVVDRATVEVQRLSQEIERLRKEIHERENALAIATQKFHLACRKAATDTRQ